jgi:lycopene cyclase domain-containing protein
MDKTATIAPTTTLYKVLKWVLPLLCVGIVFLHGYTDSVTPNNLIYKVNNVTAIPFFETHYLYLYAHIFALMPLIASIFEKKVAFFKDWKYALPALVLVAIPYWLWDIVKTDLQVWGFNSRYYTVKILNLPIEEWFFFITFPFATLLIYSSLSTFYPKSKWMERLAKIDTPLSIFIIFLCFSISFLYWGHLYTTTSFSIAGFLLLWQYLFGTQLVRLQFYRMFPIGTIGFVLVNGVFTGAFTDQPIVVYNPQEYLGIRFITIPLDDFSYNFGLELAVVMLFEFFKNRRY